MASEKKLLFFLPANNVISRVARRGIVIALLTFIAYTIQQGLLPYLSGEWIAVLSGILASLDKLIRELREK